MGKINSVGVKQMESLDSLSRELFGLWGGGVGESGYPSVWKGKRSKEHRSCFESKRKIKGYAVTGTAKKSELPNLLGQRVLEAKKEVRPKGRRDEGETKPVGG